MSTKQEERAEGLTQSPKAQDLTTTKSNRSVERLRWQIVREWRSGGKFNFTDAELNAEIERRAAAKAGVSTAGTLPLFDNGQVSKETRRESFKKTKVSRAKRRSIVEQLLDEAGGEGLTRAELASAIGVESSGVTSPVNHLIRQGIACEPFKRRSGCGHANAVVVLTKHARGTT